ncbi:MAG TPA: hypothetical protein VE010_20450, partial [Thermoanaerobaculia bacterium]|nr:hypothetical protein [Thermoanaerobaculia bacterium]
GELDPARRTDLHHQLHEVLARDQPYLWTVQVAEKWAVNKRVQNVAVSNGLGLYHWVPGPRAWWLADRVARADAAAGAARYSAAGAAASSSR